MNKKKVDDFTKEEMVEMINELSAPWDKLPIESDLAYRAFREFFCRVPANDRSVIAAYDKYLNSQGKRSSGRPNESWYKWHKTFLWLERAEAYDAYREEEIKQYAKQEQYVQLIDFRRRQRDLAGKIADGAALMIERALSALRELEHTELTPRLIPQYIKAATQVAEMASNAEASAMALDEIVNRMGLEESSFVDLVDNGDGTLRGVNVDEDDEQNHVFAELLLDFEPKEDDDYDDEQ